MAVASAIQMSRTRRAAGTSPSRLVHSSPASIAPRNARRAAASDEPLALGERVLHAVWDRLGRRRDEFGDSCSRSLAGPELLGGLVEHGGELRGGVGLVLAKREPRCERGQCDGGDVPGCFVPCE